MENSTRMIQNPLKGIKSELAHVVVLGAGADKTAIGKGCAFRLHDNRSTVIGRLEAPDVDIVLPSDSVSRRHCEISHDKDGWQISDLGSSNGVQIGFFATDPGAGIAGLKCRPVQSAKLGKFDVIQLGDYKLVFIAGPWEDPSVVTALKKLGISKLISGSRIVTL